MYPILYVNRITCETFVCTTETEAQFIRQFGIRWDLSKFDRHVVKDFARVRRDSDAVILIENDARVTPSVVLSALRSLFTRGLFERARNLWSPRS